MFKVHLDTDLGGDIDDICALAMLLRWPDVELTGITVVGDDHGRRTGYVRYVLGLEGRQDIPVAAGADVSHGYYRYELGLPPVERFWPEPVVPSPNAVEQAIDLLKQSIEQEATLIGIGPYTNLYLLDLQYPGILAQARLFLMGGYVYPPRSGYPQLENKDDFNIQVDVISSKHVLENSNPTLIPLSVTVETALRRAYLADLQTSGVLGGLLARQAKAFAVDEKMETRFGETCEGLPQDIINFQHDPLACAIALGWNEGVEIQEIPLVLEVIDGWLAARFNEFWIKRIKKDQTAKYQYDEDGRGKS
jgi:inosine-uridine nucleoside N-ribohydrolase